MSLHPRDTVGRYFDTAPADSEVRIVRVEFDRTGMFTAPDSVRQCWECLEEIHVNDEPHVKAILRYPRDLGGHGTSWAVFCSRECWGAWASVGGTP